jgi:hypothetical protein
VPFSDPPPRPQPQVTQVVNAKRERVGAKHKSLDDLAAAVGIRLTKKADASTVVPTMPKVRKKIEPVLPPKSTPPTRPVLNEATFQAILELVDNHCRQFERTPQTYQQLAEEGLRDTVLGSLNAVYEGAAGGETFQGIGKVDTHLRIAQGEVFVAELKFWEGTESLQHVVGQLRGRLTWRDSYGVALVLSRNVGFTDVLSTIKRAIPRLDGFVPGSLRELDENHFTARLSLPGDNARQATIHVITYNLYASAPAKRTVKRAS